MVVILGKLIGMWSVVCSVGMGNYEVWWFGVLMNICGLMELIVFNLGYELGFFGDWLFVVLVIMVLVIIVMIGLLLNVMECCWC